MIYIRIALGLLLLALYFQTGIFFYGRGKRVGVQEAKEAIEPELKLFRKAFEDAGVIPPTERFDIDEDRQLQRSWTGLNPDPQITEPPGTAPSWSEIPGADRYRSE